MDKLESFNLDLDVMMEELKAALQQKQHLLSNYIRALYKKIEHTDVNMRNLTKKIVELSNTQNYDLLLLFIKALSLKYEITFPETLFQAYYGPYDSFYIDLVQAWVTCYRQNTKSTENLFR